MRQDLRALAAASVLSLALTAADAAFAQKSGGILKISHFDSPARAMRRPALIGGSIGKAVDDRDTMPSSAYWLTEAAA